MKQRWIFRIVNAGLVAAGVYFVYYLATVEFYRPPEIDDALAALNRPETQFGEGVGRPLADPQATYRNLRQPAWAKPLYTLTPTPPPTPQPTPPPAPLSEVIYSWDLVSMERERVRVIDRAKQEELELVLNGPGVRVNYKGQVMEVRLCAIDLNANPPAAEFCAGGEKVTKTFG